MRARSAAECARASTRRRRRSRTQLCARWPGSGSPARSRSRRTSRASGTTCRSTRSCSCGAAGCVTCPASGTRSSAAPWTPRASATASRLAAATERRRRRADMPRKGPAAKRQLVTDPVYGSPLVTALANKVLKDGKRSVAEHIVYGALEGCREKSGNDPVITLKRALDNVKPTLEVRSRRVGGATYQVPVEVRASRSTTLALRWIVSYARNRREKTMTERLMNELLDASNGLGASVKRREDTHKMAESNKAFAHYRW